MHELPYLTSGLPGTGGRIRLRDEDFIVEEIPLYQPCGSGTHSYMLIEKRGITTSAAIRRLARALGVGERAIGCAGLKDAHSLARQWLSVEHVEPQRLLKLQLPEVRILRVERHRNKLRIGHLAGNSFTIRIRQLSEPDDAVRIAEQVMEVCLRRGVPNFFGPQRFGSRGDSHLIGRAIVRGQPREAIDLLLGGPMAGESARIRRARQLYEQGDYAAALRAWPGAFSDERRACKAMLRTGDHRRALAAISDSLRRFLTSAFQSQLFNEVLVERFETFDRVMAGDLAELHSSGAVFRVQDESAEQGRAQSKEISPTGPLFGYRVSLAEGVPGQIERAVLQRSGMGTEQFRLAGSHKIKGSRRSLRFFVRDVEVGLGHDADGSFLLLRFTLPPGAYATCLLREITKTGDLR